MKFQDRAWEIVGDDFENFENTAISTLIDKWPEAAQIALEKSEVEDPNWSSINGISFSSLLDEIPQDQEENFLQDLKLIVDNMYL